MITLHRTPLHPDGIEDSETLAFWRDLGCVMNSIHQGMSVVGPWMEARVKLMLRGWLPEGWVVSGPSQLYDERRAGIRSRSWDVVVHRAPPAHLDLPPAASPDAGRPLLPRSIVAAVIDTKTNFSDPRTYADQTVFNLMNDASEPQLAFLGADVAKIVLAASSSRSPDSMKAAGEACGLQTFSLGRYQASPVSDGEARASSWRLERHGDGSYPLQMFKAAILGAVARHEGVTSPS